MPHDGASLAPKEPLRGAERRSNLNNSLLRSCHLPLRGVIRLAAVIGPARRDSPLERGHDPTCRSITRHSPAAVIGSAGASFCPYGASFGLRPVIWPSAVIKPSGLSLASGEASLAPQERQSALRACQYHLLDLLDLFDYFDLFDLPWPGARCKVLGTHMPPHNPSLATAWRHLAFGRH